MWYSIISRVFFCTKITDRGASPIDEEIDKE